MADDIVTRLGLASEELCSWDVLEDAKAEIERLRTELNDTMERLQHVRALLKEYGHIVQRLRKGNDRLSAALYRARKHGGMVLFELEDDEADDE